MTDELSIIANGKTISGWESISLTRGIENMPSSFDILMTEKYPGQTDDVAIVPGTACQVKLGDDLVLTGYVDQYTSNITPTSHEVRMSGRSKCEDIVDCSALFNGFTTKNGQTITQIATSLCQPFGINVTNRADDGPTIPQITLNLGETPYEIIERMARWVGLLVYDDVDGNLILDRVGSTNMAGGFQQGKNVQSANLSLRTDQRFTDYYVVWQAVNEQADMGSNNQHGHAVDTDLKALGRNRPHYIVSMLVDAYSAQLDLGQKLADWECNRRWGRSQVATIVTDTWRDQNGKLWQPNALCFVDVPIIKAGNLTWLIANVTYSRDLNSGTTAQLTLMPPRAFDIEPVSLAPADADVMRALQGGATFSAPAVDAGTA